MEWLPIDTAPIEGINDHEDVRRVLICAPGWREPVIGYRYDDGGPWYHADECADVPYGECNPTHWMPLPQPPQP